MACVRIRPGGRRSGNSSGRLFPHVVLVPYVVLVLGAAVCYVDLPKLGASPVSGSAPPSNRIPPHAIRRSLLHTVLPLATLTSGARADAEEAAKPDAAPPDIGQPYQLVHVIRPKVGGVTGDKAFSFDLPRYQGKEWKDAGSTGDTVEEVLFKCKFGQRREPETLVICGPPPRPDFIKVTRDSADEPGSNVTVIAYNTVGDLDRGGTAEDLEWTTLAEGNRKTYFKVHIWARLLRRPGRKPQLLVLRVPENQHESLVPAWKIMRDSFKLEVGIILGPRY